MKTRFLFGAGLALLATLALAPTTAFADGATVTATTQAEVDALAGCIEVTGSLSIVDSGSDPITDLSALSDITSVGGHLAILGCDALTNVDGLGGLSAVGLNFLLLNCTALENVDGVCGVASVGGIVLISNNDALTNLDGLSGLTSVDGSLIVAGCEDLDEFCGLYPLLDGDGLAGGYVVAANLFNPTVEDVLAAGPCDPADLIRRFADEGAIKRGQANALNKLVGKSALSAVLAGWVKAGFLTHTQAHMLEVIAAL